MGHYDYIHSKLECMVGATSVHHLIVLSKATFLVGSMF